MKKTFQFGLLLLVFLLFIFPFFLVFDYIFPQADDFCRAFLKSDQYFSNVIHWYRSHNGRYTNSFLSLLPVYNLGLYRFVCLTSFILYIYIQFYFVRKLLVLYNLKSSFFSITFIGFLFIIINLTTLPSIYQMFYWYASLNVYLYSYLLFLLFLRYYILEFSEPKYFFLLSILIFFIIGNSEMLIGALNFLLLFKLILSSIRKKTFDKRSLWLMLFSIICSMVVVLSPATQGKLSSYSGSGDLLHSMIYSILSTGSFIIRNTFRWPHILIYLGLFLIFIILHSKNKSTRIKNFNPFILAIVSFFLLSSIVFVPYYTMGIPNLTVSRIGNLLFSVFQVIMFLNLLNLGSFVSTRLTYSKYLPFLKGMAGISILSFLGLSISDNSNYSDLYSDIFDSKLLQYKNEVESRYELLNNTESNDIELPPVRNYPSTFRKFEIKLDSNQWENRCYTKMINEMYTKQIRSIRLSKNPLD